MKKIIVLLVCIIMLFAGLLSGCHVKDTKWVLTLFDANGSELLVFEKAP